MEKCPHRTAPTTSAVFFGQPSCWRLAAQLATDPERLRAIEDRHILRILGKQKELGFEIFTDGELRRRNFMSDFTDAVEGFDMDDAVARTWQAGRRPRGCSGQQRRARDCHRQASRRRGRSPDMNFPF